MNCRIVHILKVGKFWMGDSITCDSVEPVSWRVLTLQGIAVA